MSALFISQIEVTDPAAFKQYLERTKKIAASYGVELVSSGQMKDVLNGAPAPHQMVVVARFPDMDTVRRWHASEEYQEIIPLRKKGSHQTITVYEEAAAA